MSTREKRSPPPATPDPDLADWHPTRIGPYTVLKVLGEGGMGTVYLAEQISPIRRQVALKLIKLGQDTKEVLARFEQERQALSLMNHPSIAKVLDAGAAEDGRPYFVMEVVDGIKITHYCDEQRLPIAQRLALFQQVCSGVQHAHQKGIIHRDLKPSNILITVEEGQAVPKIIDFGLALATEQKLTEQTLFTRQGQWIGTPEYMSPEQAGAAVDVDTRADIYSLGVILYELLTGQLPFESWMLREAGLAEIQRTIQEEEPPKPSSRVSGVTRAIVLNAEMRRTDPPSLRKRLRGDLDWIVMKALEKDRTRRYPTASELSADIERHMHHQPAIAGPPSFGYRSRKFLRRYRIQVVAALTVVISLVAGIILAFSQYARAEENLKLAKHRQGELEKRKLAAQQSAAAARESATVATRAREKMAEQQRIAENEFRRSNAMLRKFKFLSYATRLEEAKREAATLYPAWPENETKLRRWMLDYQPLSTELRKIRRIAGDLAQRLASYREENRDQFERLEQRYREVEALLAGTYFSDALNFVTDIRKQQEIARLRMFEDLWVDRFLHDTLVRLISDLEQFEQAELRDVRRRLAWAKRVHKLMVGEHAALWREAGEQIAASPVYGGLILKPQVGLVPLGRNPATGLWEFEHLASARRHALPASPSLRSPMTADAGIVFVLLPGGTLLRGAQRKDPTADRFDPMARAGEQPLRRLEIAPFFISKFELTRAQWPRLVGADPLTRVAAPEESPLDPADNVSHEEAERILAHHGLALPTEAQWEYAARGGSQTPWWTGRELSSLENAANLKEEWWRRAGLEADGHPGTAPVGRFRANPFGLHDICGNLAEWCRDAAGSYDEPARAVDGWRQGARSHEAVVRGGSFQSTGEEARSACRAAHRRDNHSPLIGLRPIRMPR